MSSPPTDPAALAAGLENLTVVPDVRLPLTFTAVSPISHGAGTSGNTQLLRTEEIVLPTGRRAAVPYVSGNSVRHGLRAALAWHMMRVLAIPDGSLSKRQVDLLWSGGSLTETGSQVSLDTARRVAQLLPGLSMLGYSARSDITAGTLWADNVILVCEENAHRLPPHLRAVPHAAMMAGAFRAEAFGTRHDTAGTPVDRYLTLLDAQDTLGGFAETPRESVQMIYDTQVVKPGSVLSGGLCLHAPTIGHTAALAVAFDEWAPVEGGGRRVCCLGGKRGTGHGVCEVTAPDPFPPGLRDAYEDHLRVNRASILTLLAEITG